MKVVISEFMDEAAIAAELAGFDVLYDAALVERPDALAAALAQADALIVRNRTQVRGPLLAAAMRLKVVGRLGVGLDNIDLPACRARSIAVPRGVVASRQGRSHSSLRISRSPAMSIVAKSTTHSAV